MLRVKYNAVDSIKSDEIVEAAEHVLSLDKIEEVWSYLASKFPGWVVEAPAASSIVLRKSSLHDRSLMVFTGDGHPAGIDYGHGTTNRVGDFRFGVIHSNEVLQAWADDAEAVYPENPCEKCDGSGIVPSEESEDEECECEECEGTGEADSDFLEPIGHKYVSHGYKCFEMSDGDIFIEKSPYYTRAKFCSPCAPGACYLMNPDVRGERAYCFGHDWFENGVAPYPVYSVETDMLVEPKS